MPRTTTALITFTVAATLAAATACSSADTSNSSAGRASALPTTGTSEAPVESDRPTGTSPESVEPICRPSGDVEADASIPEGEPDPAGRIGYAVVGRDDDVMGPIGTRLYAIDPDGSDAVLLLDCDMLRPQWSPDGSHLAFTVGLDDGSWQLATIAADGSDFELLTSGPGVHEIPSWSPDGSWLAYDASVDPDEPTSRVNLWRIAADGTNAAPLGATDTFDVEPRLSPTGDRVAFMRLFPEADWASEIIVRDLATGAERVVVGREIPAEHPEWSPDGTSLVFNIQDGTPDAHTIFRVDVDAATARPVVLLGGGDGTGWQGVKPVYAPDGAHIVFVCRSAGDSDDGICTMDADGANVTVLVDEPGVDENHPTWGLRAP